MHSRMHTFHVIFVNFLTLARLLMQGYGFWLYLQGDEFAGAIIAGVAPSMDLIDGWYARRFKCTTTFGAALDPFIDVVATIATAVFTLWQVDSEPVFMLMVAALVFEVIKSAWSVYCERVRGVVLRVVRIGKRGMFMRAFGLSLILVSTANDIPFNKNHVLEPGVVSVFFGLIIGLAAMADYIQQGLSRGSVSTQT